MQISLNSIKTPNWQGSILAIGLFEGNFEDQLQPLESIIKIDFLLKTLTKYNFSAKPGEVINLQLLKSDPEKLTIIGLGTPELLALETVSYTHLTLPTILRV